MPIATERVVSVLGSTSVGKSALTLMFINNEFVENYDPTIAKSYTKKNFQLDANSGSSNNQYSLTVNDTAGLEEQSQIQTMYLNSDGFILVYSIADAQSFQIVQTIYDKLLDELNGL
jgi:small GTP-binding protein